jgi:hypothetical protein
MLALRYASLLQSERPMNDHALLTVLKAGHVPVKDAYSTPLV